MAHPIKPKTLIKRLRTEAGLTPIGKYSNSADALMRRAAKQIEDLVEQLEKAQNPKLREVELKIFRLVEKVTEDCKTTNLVLRVHIDDMDILMNKREKLIKKE